MLYQNKDCAEGFKKLPASSIQLIITDPPYTKTTYQEAYTLLRDGAERVLKHGGSLITIVSTLYLPEILTILNQSKKLKYNWTIVYTHNIKTPRIKVKNIRVKQKIMLWFTKGKIREHSFIVDRIKATGDRAISKKYHHWEQDESFCRYYIKNLCKKGDIILDPFAGSGTVNITAEKLGFKSIGWEKDRSLWLRGKKKIKDLTGIEL